MLYFLLILAGVIVGLTSYAANGWIVGALVGYLLARVVGLEQRIDKLGRKLNKVAAAVSRTENKSTEPRKDQSAATESTAESAAPSAQEVTPTTKSAPAMASAPRSTPDQLASESSPPEEESAQKPKPAPQATRPPRPEPAWKKTLLALTQKAWTYLSTGNVVVKIGVLLLFVGVAFLLRYAAERAVFPVEVRYVGVLAGGLFLLIAGWRLRKRRAAFAVILQAGGVGILYLALFAALRIHHLLPGSLTFILLVLIAAFSVLLAVMQNAQSLAVLSIAGGFLAPVFASTGQGSHVQLFSYYLILGLAVFAISWFKPWRILNVLGFVFTFAIGTLWGYKYYQPQFFSSVEPFIIIFFLLYNAVAILFALKRSFNLKSYVDGTLVFGTPIAAFAIQSALLKDDPTNLSISAVVVAAFYLASAALIFRKSGTALRMLTEAFAALAVGFATLAIPLAFDGRVTSAMWSLEGAAIAWIGLKQNNALARASAYLLVILGGLAFVYESRLPAESMPFLNADFLGIVLIIGASFFVAIYMRNFEGTKQRWEGPWLQWLLALHSVVWIIGGAYLELVSKLSGQPRVAALVGVWLTGLSVTLYLARRYKFLALWFGAALTLLTMLVTHVGQTSYWMQGPLFFNYTSLSTLFACLGAWLGGTVLWSARLDFATAWRVPALSLILFFIGIGLWIVGGNQEISRYFSRPDDLAWALLFSVLSAAMCLPLSRWLKWEALDFGALAILPFAWFFIVQYMDHGVALHAGAGAQVWVIVLATVFISLKILDQRQERKTSFFHLAAIWLLVLALGIEFAELVSYLSNQQASLIRSSNLAIPFIYVATLLLFGKRLPWPVSAHRRVYLSWAPIPIMLTVYLSIWLLNLHPPGTYRLGLYLPVLNPIDASLIASLVLCLSWCQHHRSEWSGPLFIGLMSATALAAFVTLNGIVLRTLHYHWELAYRPTAIMNSATAQAALSLVWAATAVVLMIWSSRRQKRNFWLVGLALMGLVVAKLFLIDMAASGTIARIITFLGVGGLFLLVGFLSPLPTTPDQSETDET